MVTHVGYVKVKTLFCLRSGLKKTMCSALGFGYYSSLGSGRQTKNSTKCVVCAYRSDHLPDEAYTTLQVDKTPVCRLITKLNRAHISPGHVPDALSITRSIAALVDAGFRTFDIHSSDADAVSFARDYVHFVGPSTASSLDFCTSVNVQTQSLDRVHRTTVERLVDDGLSRIGLERIHLFQVSWSDFSDKRFIDFLGELQEFKRNGKVRSIGTVNFPTQHLRHISSQKIDIASNQVSFSLLDRRAMVEMVDWSRSNDLALFACFPLAAGFIDERYLGLPEPSRKAFSNASQSRFASTIRLWGGWNLFQELLYTVKQIAEKHEVTMPTVAIKWALQQPAFSAVVVGTSLGMLPDVNNCLNNIQAFQFSLDDEDRRSLEAVLGKGNDLHHILGDCGHVF